MVTAPGQVDVLVNNVGQRDRRGVDTLAPADLARMLDIHLTFVYALSQTEPPPSDTRKLTRAAQSGKGARLSRSWCAAASRRAAVVVA
jgi:NAD(P)-dependent dehydrogenase (short-subunit alcohol dehydrogenase family)